MFPKDNPESWRQIRGIIDEYPDDERWLIWKSMARNLVSALEARGLVSTFRIGQGMHHTILSTLDHHRLLSEPRVTLEFHPEEQTVRIAYSCSNLSFNKPLAQETAPMTVAMPVTIGYLRRLWVETKPN